MASLPFSRSVRAAAAEGRLTARPLATPTERPPRPGTHPLRLEEGRDGLFHVPESAADAARPLPLVVLLHGAGGTGRSILPVLRELADRHGMLVLAPDSRRGDTWDVIRDGFGPDVGFIDCALDHVFSRVVVDPARVAVGGFSDGGSYALSLGLGNGDLFGDVLAFSPGFAAPRRTAGAPDIFISHGDADTVLPVDRCGRRLARELTRAGYDVDYREFAGGHVVPPDLALAAVERFLA